MFKWRKKDKKKLHFMHLPKTGGTSLANFIEKQFKSVEVCPFVYLRGAASWAPKYKIMQEITDLKNREYRFFKGHLGWVPRLLFSDDEIETITFLRDPIARALSIYHYKKGNIIHWDPNPITWDSFDNFVFDSQWGLKLLSNWQTKLFCADLYFQKSFSFKPSNSYLEDLGLLRWTEIDLKPDKMLELAIERLHACAFVGLTENFGESLNWLCTQYKWLPPREAPKQNVSIKLEKLAQIKPATVDYIQELNQLDFSLYQEAVKIFHERKKTRVYFDRQKFEQAIVVKTPSRRKIEFNFADNVIGEGWDAREGIPPNLFCWSSSRNATLVFAIKKQTALSISFKILHSMLANLHEKLVLTANSFHVELALQPHFEGGLVFEGVIPVVALYKKKFLEICFLIPELIRPIDVNQNSKDLRKLGFALSELSLKPLMGESREPDTRK